jgi:hypothetical protein
VVRGHEGDTQPSGGRVNLRRTRGLWGPRRRASRALRQSAARTTTRADLGLDQSTPVRPHAARFIANSANPEQRGGTRIHPITPRPAKRTARHEFRNASVSKLLTTSVSGGSLTLNVTSAPIPALG